MSDATCASGQSAAIREWQRFVLRESHVLSQVPELLFQLAVNQPTGTAPAAAALDRLGAGRETRPWLRRLNKPAQGSGLLMTLASREASVSACAFLTDGSKIVSGSDTAPYGLTVWDASTGREMLNLGLDSGVQACAFSPRGDRLAVTSTGPWGRSHFARVLDAATGAELASLHVDYESWEPRSCAFSPDGERLAIGSGTRLERLSIFDGSTGRHLAELVLGDRDAVGYVPACAFSADGRFVAAASPACVKAWDTATFSELLAGASITEAYTPAHPRTLAFSSDSRRLLVAYSNMAVRVWDTGTWNEVTALKAAGSVETAAFSADGRLVACSEQNNLLLWDLSAQSEPKRLGQHGLAITCCAFAPDGRLVSGSYDKTLKIWNTSSSRGAQSGHSGRITACGFSPDGSRVATSSADKTLRVWDAATGGEIAVLAGHGREVQGFEFSRDGNRLLSRADDGVIAWDVPGGRLLAKLGPWFGDIVVRGSAISPDGAFVALGCRHHRLELVDPATGKTLVNFGAHGDNPRDFVEACRFLSGGRRLLSVGFQGTFKLWDTACGALVASVTAPSGSSLGWAATADGERFVIQWTHKTIKVWDGCTGQELATVGLPHTLNDLAVSPDSRTLATALYDHTIRLWDVRTGMELASRIEVKTRGLAFSPDGTRLLAIEDGRPAPLSVWDVATASRISVFGRESSGMCFSPDGTIVVSSRDEWLRFWDVATGSQITCQRLSTSFPEVAWSPDGSVVAVGDSSGEFHLLRLEGHVRQALRS